MKKMYSIYDKENGILYDRYIFSSREEAQAEADLRNSVPSVRRLTPRPRPEYVVVEVEATGLENMLVGLREGYRIVEGGDHDRR